MVNYFLFHIAEQLCITWFLIILIINKVSKTSKVSEATNLTTIFLSHISDGLYILTTFNQYKKTTAYINKYNSVTKFMDAHDI